MISISIKKLTSRQQVPWTSVVYIIGPLSVVLSYIVNVSEKLINKLNQVQFTLFQIQGCQIMFTIQCCHATSTSGCYCLSVLFISYISAGKEPWNLSVRSIYYDVSIIVQFN
eukprot:NODE_887_length_3432_cov_0.206421.p4 type:complete len:112 gc:universal NODE_887_length_3432_cov_0.206421:2950-2615(-)